MKRNAKVTFFSSPQFFAVEHWTRKLTWRERIRALFGAEIMVVWEPIPSPKVVTLGPGLYFGHPETIARVKADIEKALEIAGGKSDKGGKS